MLSGCVSQWLAAGNWSQTNCISDEWVMHLSQWLASILFTRPSPALQGCTNLVWTLENNRVMATLFTIKRKWKECFTYRWTEREIFYLTTHSTHFIYGYMVSDIWLRTILIVRNETRCRHIGYSYRLAARVLLYAPSHRQDNTYHGLCYTSRGALAGTRQMNKTHDYNIHLWFKCTVSLGTHFGYLGCLGRV